MHLQNYYAAPQYTISLVVYELYGPSSLEHRQVEPRGDVLLAVGGQNVFVLHTKLGILCILCTAIVKVSPRNPTKKNPAK